jgi:uncharacterized protein
MAAPADTKLSTEMRDRVLRIASRHHVENVRAFGSRARGEAGVDSDLDLLVAMAEGSSLFNLVAFSQELSDELDLRVDVLSEGGLSPYLRERILEEAVAL